ncbi:hypothetical protein EVAR_54356_1 [Eumeta japonica]|uniref:Uncharacterized protein n=1 Tax=Eumeta variegata TaxID=151549 RepID=A0A4C1Z8U4_EUMVA|nr:hypothetical protein EVAR_54356_1 [Eumeta japonica]
MSIATPRRRAESGAHKSRRHAHEGRGGAAPARDKAQIKLVFARVEVFNGAARTPPAIVPPRASMRRSSAAHPLHRNKARLGLSCDRRNGNTARSPTPCWDGVGDFVRFAFAQVSRWVRYASRSGARAPAEPEPGRAPPPPELYEEIKFVFADPPALRASSIP